MDEYISKEETVKTIQYRVCQGYGNKEHICKRGSCAYCGIMEIIDDISSIEAAGVQPVKHGHWIEHHDDIFPLESTIECSVCGEQESVNIHNDNFCPNCGCKMGGDSE